MKLTHIWRVLLFGTVVVGIGHIYEADANHEAPPTDITALEHGKDVHIAATHRPPPPPPPRPEPPTQPASDALWVKFKNKGCTLAWAMQANDADVGPAYNPARDTASSPYRSVNDLEKWLWRPFPRDRTNPKMHDFYNTWGVGRALEGLGVNPISFEYEGGKNELFFLDHQSFEPRKGDVDSQWYIVDGIFYRATGASYAFTINWEEGVIMGLNRLSPRYAAKERVPVVQADELPLLNQFSDVAWIGWDAVVQREGSDVRRLKYFLALGIDNKDTQATILRAMAMRGWTLRAWPGHVFERQWMEARALMGTVNVQGFAYFLIQHKDRLGNMFIDKLQVFHGDTPHQNPCIVMHLSQPRSEAEVERGDEGMEHVRVHTMRAML